MIYTVTFSPALDYIVDLDEFVIGSINRTQKETILPGGKGINVSIVLSNLGTKSVALGFIGGFIGKYIEEEMASHSIDYDFVKVNGNITFTNEAAQEMKERIRTAIKKIPSLEEQLNYLDSAYITTFDSYSLSIVKKYHYILNISKNITSLILRFF